MSLEYKLKYEKYKLKYLNLKHGGDLNEFKLTSNPNIILQSNDPFFTKAITIPKMELKYAKTVLDEMMPESLFVAPNGTIYPKNIKSNIILSDVHGIHWGQRKLLLSEIQFMTPFHNQDFLVIYAGSADGRHINLLTKMFPTFEFHLYDPRKFYETLYSNKSIHINPYYTDKNDPQYGFFTDDVAKFYGQSYPDRKILFISDIRTMPEEGDDDFSNVVRGDQNLLEENVMGNQNAQKKWTMILTPVATILKFKMPYPLKNSPKYYEYLDGKIQLQCWAPQISSETRLIVTGDLHNVWYSVTQYERKMAYYNNYVRPFDYSAFKLSYFGIPFDITFKSFWHPIFNGNIGFDFVYELLILYAYINKLNDNATLDDLKDIVAMINVNLMDIGTKFSHYLKIKKRKFVTNSLNV